MLVCVLCAEGTQVRAVTAPVSEFTPVASESNGECGR